MVFFFKSFLKIYQQKSFKGSKIYTPNYTLEKLWFYFLGVSFQDVVFPNVITLNRCSIVCLVSFKCLNWNILSTLSFSNFLSTPKVEFALGTVPKGFWFCDLKPYCFCLVSLPFLKACGQKNLWYWFIKIANHNNVLFF